MLVKLRDGSSVPAIDVKAIEVNTTSFPDHMAVIVHLAIGSIGARIFLFNYLDEAQEYALEIYESVNAALREAGACHDVASPTTSI